jgi:O-methyltransferase
MSRLSAAKRAVNALLAPTGFEFARIRSEPDLVETAESNGTHRDYERLTKLRYAPWRRDDAFQRVWQAVQGHTLVEQERCYELWTLVHQGTPGDILEVGVWRGGTGAILAAALNRVNPAARVTLADTFAGVVKAGPKDVGGRYRGGEHADTSQDVVQRLLDGLSLTNTRLLVGIFPDACDGPLPVGPFSLCHVDVDTYESARGVVEWVEPMLTGWLVFDDYGFKSCPGITAYVDDLVASSRWHWVYNLNGHAVLWKRRAP